MRKNTIMLSLKSRQDWPEIELAMSKKLLKLEKLKNGRVSLFVKDRYGRWWPLRVERLPENVNWSDYKPLKYSSLCGISREEFFTDYKLKLRADWEKMKYAMENGKLNIVQSGTSCYVSVKDRYDRWWVLYNLKENDVLDWLDYKPKKYDKSCNMTPEEFYTDYFLKFRDDWSDIEKGLENGYVKLSRHSNGHSLTLSVRDRYGTWWKLRMERLKKSVNWSDYRPERYEKSFDMSQEQFFVKYTLMFRSDWDAIENAMKQGNIELSAGPNGTYKVSVKDRYGRWWTINWLKPEDIVNWSDYRPVKYESGYMKRYPELTRKRFYIEYALAFRKDWPKIKKGMDDGWLWVDKVNAHDNGKYELTLYIKDVKDNVYPLYNFANRVRVNYEKLRLGLGPQFQFIMPYDDTRRVLDELDDGVLHVLDPPLVLREEDLERELAGRAVVWDLYDPDVQAVVYVGEHRRGLDELEALRLHVRHDKEGTRARRRQEFGLGERQPLLDRLYDGRPHLQLRLRAHAAEGEARAVRALEAVLDVEENRGAGALVRQARGVQHVREVHGQQEGGRTR